MQLDTGVKKIIFVIFVISMICNVSLMCQCKNYSESINKMECAYRKKIFVLQQKLHDHGIGYRE
jgi:hypothetical protein